MDVDVEVEVEVEVGVGDEVSEEVDVQLGVEDAEGVTDTAGRFAKFTNVYVAWSPAAFMTAPEVFTPRPAPESMGCVAAASL